MVPRWKLKATTIKGGFALSLIGDGDLGEALLDAEEVAVEMEDGQTLRLYEALVDLIQSRVTGFVVFTEPFAIRQRAEWLH